MHTTNLQTLAMYKFYCMLVRTHVPLLTLAAKCVASLLDENAKNAIAVSA